MLVVEDNVDMAMSLSIILQMHGHKVEMAHDGSAALEICRVRDFDVILLDIGLPSIDGYEVARRIRGVPASPGPCSWASAAMDSRPITGGAREAGFDLYLVKPVDPRLLESLLEQWTRDAVNPGASPG